MLFVLIAVFSILVLSGVPVAFSMGVAAVAGMLVDGSLPWNMVAHTTIYGTDSFVYLSIPLFILAGALMDRGGIAGRLVRLAKVLTGGLRGGLAYSVVIFEMFFSGLSGSTVADVSAMTSTVVNPMRQVGYRKEHILSIIAGASAAGILIPPCNMMVILGALANTSVLALFVAGIVPAIILFLLIIALLGWQAMTRNLPREKASSLKEIGKAIREALLAAGLPVVIFGGILAGIATITEVAAIAVVYAAIVGVVVYGEVKLDELPKLIVDSAVSTGMIMFILGLGSIFSFLLATQHVPQAFAQFIRANDLSPFIALFIMMVVYVVFGSILETVPALLIFTPIFLPVVRALHIDMLQFSMVVIAAIGLGMFLPPAGLGTLTLCAVGDTKMQALVKPLIPFLAILFIGLTILVAFPAISSFLPTYLGMKY
jgi:tripartite ATP-independent transporter DctM subunit